MMLEVLKQARNAFVWNLNTDLDNIPACDQWAKMLRKNIDDLDKVIAEFDSHTLYREGYVNGYAFGEAAGKQAIAELESQEPFGIWHQGATDEESDFYLYSESGDVSCPTCIKLYTHPPQRTWVGSGDLEDSNAYQTPPAQPTQPAKPIPCANHCEATAFEIVIKNLQGEIERLKASQRTWVGLTDERREQLIQKCWREYIAGKEDGTTFGEWMSVATEAELKEKNNA